MTTIQDIQARFGASGVADLHVRMQFMTPELRQEFIDACIRYDAPPGTSWDGGHFGDPFIPHYLNKEK